MKWNMKPSPKSECQNSPEERGHSGRSFKNAKITPKMNGNANHKNLIRNMLLAKTLQNYLVYGN